MPYRHTLRVRYQECDPQGVVYFARYPEYYDLTITELWRDTMDGYQGMVDAGADMVVAEMSIRYLASARFDDLIDVDVVVDRLGETSMASSFLISSEREALVEGSLRHVFINPETKTKRPIPDEIRRALEPYLAA
ncbi:MAG: acyl-CoA thioester hydrolase [Solirubrobacteraceae bacterium]|nr:acyl-CoA thioester hydrolase [Solirubrobacteraceae bacterium]